LSRQPAHLAARLQQTKAATVEVNQNHVSFTGGLFGSGRNRWDILIPFGFGDLTVASDTRQLTYRLSFRELFVAGTIMVGILTGFSYFAWHSLAGLLAAPIWWIWLVGLNLFIGLAARIMSIRDFSTTEKRSLVTIEPNRELHKFYRFSAAAGWDSLLSGTRLEAAVWHLSLEGEKLENPAVTRAAERKQQRTGSSA
jgi:hypothetical protein